MDGWTHGKCFYVFSTQRRTCSPIKEKSEVSKVHFIAAKKTLITINFFQPAISGIDCKAKSYKFLDRNTKIIKSLSQRWSDKSQLDGEKSALLLVKVHFQSNFEQYINI